MPLSPLGYPGGKARALSKIAPFFPAMDMIKEYREPFLGGGSVFLYLKENYGKYYPGISWWVNELEPYLYNFWVILRDDPKNLVYHIEQYLNKPLSEIKLTKQNSHLENAAVFFIKNQSSYGGMALKKISPRMFVEYKKFIYDKDKVYEKFVMLSKLLNGVKITNLDYSALMKENVDGNIFIFLDPPYFKAKNLYGKSEKFNLHSTFDYYRFAKNVGRIAGSSNVKLMITYDDAETLRHLYSKIKEVKIIPFEFRYSINEKIGHEIMIVNYKSENVITKQTVLI